MAKFLFWWSANAPELLSSGFSGLVFMGEGPAPKRIQGHRSVAGNAAWILPRT